MDPNDFDPQSIPCSPPPPLDEPVPDAGFETLCEHFAEDRTTFRGAVAVPIYQASTFVYPNVEAWEHSRDPGSPYFQYTRVGNPTTGILEAKLARLESGRWAFSFGSGMGAISSAINACVHAGAHVVAAAGIYWPTQRYLRNYLPRFGVEATFVDGTDPAAFAAAIRPNTKLMYLESPASGYFDVLDIPPIAAAARERGVVTVFDNSWATPCFQRPLELGCDLVVHSATKYIGGHSDVVAGVVAGRDETLRRRVFRELELLGAVTDPFAAWLLLRGLRTLRLRMEQHQRSGLVIARFLEQHPGVRRVHHPGLESHPRHEIAKRQMSGYGGLFSFELKEQSREAAFRFVNSLKLFSVGVSWGGYESLALAGTFFARASEPPTWLVRLHVGLETTENLVEDVRQALQAKVTK
jgi:cystathionine beta-lyase